MLVSTDNLSVNHIAGDINHSVAFDEEIPGKNSSIKDKSMPIRTLGTKKTILLVLFTCTFPFAISRAYQKVPWALTRLRALGLLGIFKYWMKYSIPRENRRY